MDDNRVKKPTILANVRPESGIGLRVVTAISACLSGLVAICVLLTAPGCSESGVEPGQKVTAPSSSVPNSQAPPDSQSSARPPRSIATH